MWQNTICLQGAQGKKKKAPQNKLHCFLLKIHYEVNGIFNYEESVRLKCRQTGRCMLVSSLKSLTSLFLLQCSLIFFPQLNSTGKIAPDFAADMRFLLLGHIILK